MKIAVPVVEETVESTISLSFGRAPYFLIYDADNKESFFLENSAAESTGGASIKASQIVADSGVEILITPSCGKNAADTLEAAGIIMYRALPVSAGENIEAFFEGKLTELDAVLSGEGGRSSQST